MVFEDGLSGQDILAWFVFGGYGLEPWVVECLAGIGPTNWIFIEKFAYEILGI